MCLCFKLNPNDNQTKKICELKVKLKHLKNPNKNPKTIFIVLFLSVVISFSLFSHICRITHEHLIGKCDRLQANLSEANSRAEFLAAEVDEQHLRMEQTSADKLL